MIWEIDPVHSQVSFAIRVMRLSTTRGRFTMPRGRLSMDEQSPAHSWVKAEVAAASVETHNGLRDVHLRSAAFLAVKHYPKISFQSTQVEQISDQTYLVTGNLTLHGMTRPITFDVSYRGRGQQKASSASAHLSATATISRNDFGVGRGLGVRVAAGALVSIELELALEAVRQSSDVHEETVTKAR